MTYMQNALHAYLPQVTGKHVNLRSRERLRPQLSSCQLTLPQVPAPADPAPVGAGGRLGTQILLRVGVPPMNSSNGQEVNDSTTYW